MTNPTEPSGETLVSLKPTQEQLQKLSDTLVSFEPENTPFSDIPPEIENLGSFVELVSPPMADERLSPSSLHKSLDGRVIWTTTFRNPDSNKITSQHISIIEDEDTRTDYLVEPNKCTFSIQGPEGTLLNRFDIDDLQKLLNESTPFNPFDQE